MTFQGAQPTVCILLATHNAEAWLDAQIESIAGQQNVRAFIVASDDASTDGTLDLLIRREQRISINVLPPLPQRLGNANRNFLRLIRDAPSAGYDYIAMSDHDDVWLPNKLISAILSLRQTGANAYSGSITAFWPDGRELLLDKSGPQRRYDYLFQSPGPGCTYVFPQRVFLELQAWVTARFDSLQDINVHDWLIYAYARRNGWRWYIDPNSYMRYRQHSTNEIGANAGFSAALSRWRRARSGEWRLDVLEIANAVDDKSIIVEWLDRLNWIDRLRLFTNIRQCRRSFKDAAFAGLLFLTMAKLAPRSRVKQSISSGSQYP